LDFVNTTSRRRDRVAVRVRSLMAQADNATAVLRNDDNQNLRACFPKGQ
jgi:hypothetical protein